MKLNTMSRLALALSAALLVVGCSRSSSAPSPSAHEAPVVGTSTLEAAGACLPRQCGPRPICLANSVATCSTDTGCKWKCVPLIGPI
jgi:hypothetical protein